MRFQFRKLLLVCLATVLGNCAFCAQLHNPYDIELQKLQSRLPEAGTLQQLVLLERISGLWDLVDDRSSITRVFAGLAENPKVAELVRIEGKACLKQIETSDQPRRWYQQEQTRTQVLAQAQQAASSAGGLETLAELEHMAGVAAAAEHMQQAALREPTPRRWEQAAEYTVDPLRKFAALQAGLALDSQNAQLSRQLAIYYIGRQQLEKAQDVLTKALRAAPDDFVLVLKMAELHMNLGLRSAALHELKDLEQRWPSPLWLKSRIAVDYEQIGLLEDAARLANALLQEKPASREALELLTRFHERRHMARELVVDYTRLLSLEPDAPELWSKLAQLQESSGDLPQARNSLLRLAALEPKDAEAHRRLAAIDQRLDLAQETRKETSLAAELLHASSKKADPDAKLLSDPQALAAEAFRHPPQESDLVLADTRIQQLYETGVNRVHVQQIFYVGSESAAEAHHVTLIRYSPGSEDLQVHHARIWKRDGTVVEAQELGESPVADNNVSMYYDMRARQIRFTRLEKGDVAELDYSLVPTSAHSPYAGYFGELVTFASRTPARMKRYALIVPAAQKIFVHGEKVEAASSTEKDRLHTILWEMHNLPALSREPRSPGVTETSPYVHVSTFADWSKLGEWYAKLIEPQFALDHALQEELARLVKGRHSEQEKITAIQEFVLRNTHYVALEFGIYSYKPYPVSQTYARRFGDCKDKASLMIALLRAAGIEADIALLRTRSMGDVVPEPASIALFDHAIVYIPKYKLWLDGTAEYSGRELPPDDQGALALTVSLNGQAQLQQVPTSTADENYTKRVIHAELSPQGMIHFSGSTLTRGEDAPRLRRDLSVQEQQLDQFRQRLAQVFPAVELDNVNVHGAENLESDVSVDFQGELNSFAHKQVVMLSSSWMSRDYLSALAPVGNRTQDLVLPSAWITEEEIHVELPRGAVIQQLPKDQEIATSFGSVKLHYVHSGREIVIQSRLQLEKTRINTQEYPAFRQFCAQLERTFRNEIVVGLAR